MTKSYSEATNLWESCHSGVQHHITSSTFVNSTQDSNLNCDWMFATLLSSDSAVTASFLDTLVFSYPVFNVLYS